MVGDKQDKTRQQQNNSVKLEASLAPAEAEVGARAKADQKSLFASKVKRKLSCILNVKL